jgi:uncharacterized sulfatase
MSGIDLLDERAVRNRKAVFGECFTHTSVDLEHPAASLRWRWVREGDWKLILPAPQNEPSGMVELFNLATDATEEKNLAAAESKRVARLTKMLDRWWDGK